MSREVTDDLFFGGRLRLLQPRRGHRVGTDAALLVAAARSRLSAEAVAADLGTGTGAVGLALACAGAARVTLVEIDEDLAALAAENIRRNGLEDRACASCADVATLGTGRGPAEPSAGSCDLVVSNPPFDDEARFRLSPDATKSRAHGATPGLLSEWAQAANRLLRPGGAFVLIHRAEALGEVLDALENRFGDVRVLPVHPRADQPAARIIVAARKARRGPLALLPGLVLHDADGAFTKRCEAAQRGETTFALD
ncbi:tRNA1(Val) (adenine(37)-N6)-methyltransferase [Hansschlegelia sp.]|uniref:tRNA1(Val) (adenine(37)-N6)-methyltransferase n=1 Tax=Hansschlegelia sp. TaxID=2041892 RepID=UPI002BF34E81|nr:methyltransferase [Hansschlegelia sp.]HVI30313.1 methyltransferase [Hansschlegelia sp.]